MRCPIEIDGGICSSLCNSLKLCARMHLYYTCFLGTEYILVLLSKLLLQVKLIVLIYGNMPEAEFTF